jgi:catechol 2,3-dioxygenase-like lactoylglutathione lyase family enzyme
MQWSLHHVNIPSHNVRETARFYEDILDMTEKPFPFVSSDQRGAVQTGDDFIAFFEDGSRQIHICKPTPEMPFQNNFCLHPVLNGHLAINVDDIEEVKRRLRARDHHFNDAGKWAFAGYYQIYFYDPSMNVVEVNQRYG